MSGPRKAGRGRPRHGPRGAADAATGHSNRWVDAAIVVTIVVAWVLVARAVSHGVPAVTYDTFRDMAYAENILAGRLFADPSLTGLPWWYPPGNPLLFAGLSRVLGRPLVDLYPSSMYWLNVLNPVLLYLLVRMIWRSRAAGLIAVLMAGLGSFWWLTHAAAPMPSVQGIALNLATLIVWHRAQRGPWPWAAGTGVLIAASLWHHAICGMFLLGAIGLHGLMSTAHRPEASGGDRTALLRRAALTCGVGLALALPLLWHVLTLARTNSDPIRWFAPELHDLHHALHAHAPLVLPLGLVGFWRVLRTTPAAGWLVAYAAVGVGGQLVGYLAHDLHWPLPYAIPHEFQWHEQLALAIAAAVGLLWCAERLAALARGAVARRRLRAMAIVLIASLTLGPALTHAHRADDVFMHLDAGWGTTLRTCRWVREHLPIDAVIACNPDAGYYLNGLTGRKVVALPAGHMNPASDVKRRYQDLQTMLTTPEPGPFATVAARYGVSHLLVVPRVGDVSGAREIYARWPILEPVDLGDVNLLLYRVKGRPSRVPASPKTPPVAPR